MQTHTAQKKNLGEECSTTKLFTFITQLNVGKLNKNIANST